MNVRQYFSSYTNTEANIYLSSRHKTENTIAESIVMSVCEQLFKTYCKKQIFHICIIHIYLLNC